MSSPDSSVAVIGAGVVGLASALSMQRAGFAVKLIDPEQPALRASTATAGIVGGSAVIPWLSAGLWRRLPGMLMDRDSPLQLSWRQPAELLAFLRRCRAAGAEAAYRESSAGLAALGLDGYRHWMQLLGGCKPARELFYRNGCSFLYITEAARQADEPNNQLREQHGMALEQRSAAETLAVMPDLATAPAGSVNVVQAGHIDDPLGLQQHMLADFLDRGGERVRASACGFITSGSRVAGVATTCSRVMVGSVVIAAGYNSQRLARQLGCNVPMLAGYGTGILLEQCNVVLDAPLLVLDQGLAVVPNRRGLRVAGLVSLGAVSQRRQTALLMRKLARLFGPMRYKAMHTSSGARPLTPDSLPVISRAPLYSNAFFNFGHGHWGLTQAARSAAMLRALVAGEPLDSDIGRYSAARFHAG